jgi:2-polyprenyl-3-methyl-5-hydroxy-6-metoxy-1,4-benzoquinol methylase
MYKLYGKDKTDQEVKQFISNYVEGIKKDKHGRYNDILKLIGSGNGKFLDYGCGWGHYSYTASERGYDVTGIDYAENEINICKLVYSENERLHFEKKSITDIDSNAYDIVLSSQVIEHVHNCGTYLNEINRVLKPGGRLIISTPNIVAPRFIFSLLSPKLEKNLIETSKRINNEYDKTHNHINGWDPVHFTQLVSTVGFTLVKFMPSEGVPFPMRRPFKPYMYFKNRLKNLCYTMIFEFEKTNGSNIGRYD